MLLSSPSSSSSSAFTSSFVGAGVGGGLFSLCGLTPPISPAAANGAGLAQAHAAATPPHALFHSHASTPTALQSHPTLHMFLSAPSSAVPSRTQSPADGSTAMSDLGLSRDGAMIDSLSSRDTHAGARFSFSFNSAGGLTPMMMLSHSATHSRPHSPNANHAFASPPQPAHAQLGAMHSQPLFALNSDGSTAIVGSPHLHGLFASLLKEGSCPPSLSSGVVHSSAPASLHPSPPHTLRAHGGGSRDSSGDSWSHNRMDLTDNSKAVFELFDPVPLASHWHARLAHTNGATAFADRGSSSSTFGSSLALSNGTGGGSSRTSSLPHSQVQSPVSRMPAYLSLQAIQSHARTPPSLSSMLAQSSLNQSQPPPQRLSQSHHEPSLHSAQLRSHASPAHAENPVSEASGGSNPASLPAPLRSGGSALFPKQSVADLSESHAMAPRDSSGSSVLSSPSAAAGSSKPPTAFVCEVCQKQFTQKGQCRRKLGGETGIQLHGSLARTLLSRRPRLAFLCCQAACRITREFTKESAPSSASGRDATKPSLKRSAHTGESAASGLKPTCFTLPLACCCCGLLCSAISRAINDVTLVSLPRSMQPRLASPLGELTPCAMRCLVCADAGEKPYKVKTLRRMTGAQTHLA